MRVEYLKSRVIDVAHPSNLTINGRGDNDLNKKLVKDSSFLKEYVKQATKSICMIYPDLKKEDIQPIIIREVENRLMNPPARIENSYTREARDTTLLSVLDYVIETKPIIAANGTFFKQHKDSINPNAKMLDQFGENRSIEKKLMFACQGIDEIEYNIHNIDQTNWKKLSNSWYGGSAMPASAMYNKECAASTTKTARSVISTCMTTFEAVLGDTFTFVDIQEFLTWCKVVMKENNELEPWIERKSAEDVYNRFYHRIVKKEAGDDILVRDLCNALSETARTQLYWKYNLLEFTRTHKEVRDLFQDVYNGVEHLEYMKDDGDWGVVPEKYRAEVEGSRDKPAKAWKKIVQRERFYDPAKIPSAIDFPVRELCRLYVKYIYVDFMFTDRMYKLKNFKRNVVTVIDTDSNILSLDPWIEYCFDELMQGRSYGRPRIDNVFININTTTYMITEVIAKALDNYGRHSNVDDENRWRYQMKNEFFFCKLILANVKKRYLSKMLLREGNYLVKPTYDIKGYDFRKASTSAETSDFYINIVKNELLEAEKIDIPRIMGILRDFRAEIKASLQRGEVKYLPVGSPKELESYVDPKKNQSVRALLAWNNIYPEDMIDLPAKIAILKTNIFKIDVIKDLKHTHPRIYDRIEEKIFNDNTGFFVKMMSDSEKVEGLSVIGIPLTTKIPDWLIPYIDYQTVVNAVLAPFKSVTETFGIPSITEGPTGRKSTGFSNIVKF